MFIFRILGGLLVLATGAAITIYAEKMLNVFGRVDFAEKYFGSEGGSRLFYRVLGILVALFGMALTVNVHGDILRWILSPLIRQ